MFFFSNLIAYISNVNILCDKRRVFLAKESLFLAYYPRLIIRGYLVNKGGNHHRVSAGT